MSIWKLFGEPRFTYEDIKNVAGEVKFSDADLKKIAHAIVESETETGRLDRQVLLDSDSIELIAKKILTSFKFIGMLFGMLLFLGGIVYFTILRSTFAQITDTANQMKQDSTNVLANTEAYIATSHSNLLTTISNKLRGDEFVKVIKEASGDLLRREIQPSIDIFKSQLKDSLNGLETNIKSMTTNINDMQTEAKVYMLITKASMGERAAYGQLRLTDWSTNSAVSDLVNLGIMNIIEHVQTEQLMSKTFGINGDPWVGTGKSAETATFADYRARLQNTPDIAARTLLRQMNSQTRFPLEDRLHFLAWVARFYNRLSAVSEACNLMNSEAKLNLSFNGEAQYVEWFETKYKTKVQLNY